MRDIGNDRIDFLLGSAEIKSTAVIIFRMAELSQVLLANNYKSFAPTKEKGTYRFENRFPFSQTKTGILTRKYPSITFQWQKMKQFRFHSAQPSRLIAFFFGLIISQTYNFV